MTTNIVLLDLGSAITDIFAFLAPADHHKLRCTTAAMCEWFDSAAENGSLAIFVTFAPSAVAAGPLRWKHAASDPYGAGPRQEPSLAFPQATVTVHVRNYYLSTLNAQASGATDDAIIDKATIRLVDDFPFEHKLVVTGLFGIRSIGDGFCRGVKASSVELKTDDALLQSVGRGWMSECDELKSINFIGFSALEEVGNDWMSFCLELENVSFARSSTLKKVGNGWMSTCENLKLVDLAGLTALEEVGDNWMFRCLSLESVSFAGFNELAKVGSSWMSYCVNVKQFDFTGLTALKEVGNDWMSECSSLECITIVGELPNLKKVGTCWMFCCNKLKHVDLSGFTVLEEVGDSWLFRCSSLESITFASDVSNLKKVGSNWMSTCKNLKHVDLTGLTALEEVGGYWLSHCLSLESITFASLMPKLKKVGTHWMASCNNLKHVDLTGFTTLEEVGYDWLRSCSCLERITLPNDMPNLRWTGDKWTPESECPLSDHLLQRSKLRY